MSNRGDSGESGAVPAGHPSFAEPEPLWIRALRFIGPLPERRPDRAWFRFSAWKDLSLAVFLCGCVTIGSIGVVLFRSDHTVGLIHIAAFALSLIPLALLAWRPRLCEWLLVVSLATWALTMAISSDGSDFPVSICIYTIATYRSWQRTMVSILIAVGFGLIVNVTWAHMDRTWLPYLQTIPMTMFYSVVAAVGLWLGRRRAYVRTLVQRAEKLERERLVLQRERDAMAKHAVAVERARVARELHDVVAHHVSVMVIQAGAAQASLPPGSEVTGQALEAIRETGREAMAEMRRLLGLLRAEDPQGTAEDDDGVFTRSPQPGMTDLEALAARTREAGVEVSLEVAGAPRHIPPGIELSAYRVAQEALTNTMRHAGPGSSATLRLLFEPGVLAVEVVDDGRGRPAMEAVERPHRGFGHGLVGMRERVALFGGRLETGPQPGGGYRVLARFPLDEGPQVNLDQPARAGEISPANREVTR
ncbi:MAG TPA: sensor histidine kinase [Candidatus Limnocylindrales bacterium]